MTFRFDIGVISKALKKKDSTLDFNQKDVLVRNLCGLDFQVYQDYISNVYNDIEIQNDDVEITMDFLSGRTSVEEIYKQIQSKNEDREKFIIAWVNWWWTKFQNRVKISLEKPKKSFITERGKHIFEQEFTPEERRELVKMVTLNLVSYGEICFCAIIALNIIFKLLGIYCPNSNWTIQDKLNFTSRVLKLSKKISKSKDFKINFIPPKEYFEDIKFIRDEDNNDGDKI